jgi:hypothetical protein
MFQLFTEALEYWSLKYEICKKITSRDENM